MKRLSSQLCNLESRMRKEAADDLQKELHLQAELRERASKRIKVDDSGQAFYTKDSLPSSMFHLGGDNYVSIVFFMSHTRVHIRKFSTDDEGFLHPTKDGVSLSPSVWLSFQKKCYNFPGQILFVDKDLCVSRETQDEGNFYVFQKLFQRKNFSFQFLPENVILSGVHMANLQYLFSDINVKVKECLLQNTLAHFVSYEHSQRETEVDNSNSDTFCDLHNFINLTSSLTKCLTKYVSGKINEIFHCFACKEKYPMSDLHSCATYSFTEKFEEYFDVAFYNLDWRQIAKDFYNENVNDFLFVPIDDFFAFLNVTDILSDVKKMYTNNQQN